MKSQAARRLKELERENLRLKKAVADVALELADLRMALDTMCRRLTVWLANGFDHPVPTASNAPLP